MTKPIPSGTRNFSLNLVADEKAYFGRLAHLAGKSLNRYFLDLAHKGLAQENPEAAERVSAIRRAYFSGTLLGIFLAALIVGHDDMTRARVRTRRVEEIREEMEAI